MLLNLSILTILLSIVLGLFNRNKNSNSLFLAGFFFISSGFGIAHHYVFHEKEVFATALLFNHLVPFMFLIGPFILFYVRGALNEERRLKTIDILHFIPAIVSGIGTMPYYIQSLETKLKIAEQLIANLNSLRTIDVNLFYDAGESFFYRTVLCLVYVLCSLYKVFQKQRFFKNRSTPMTRQEKQVMQWLWILLLALLSISFIFLFLALQTAAYSIKEVIAYSYPYYLLSGVIYFIMALSLFQFPNVLYGLVPRESVPETIEEVEEPPVLIKKKKEIKKREKPYGEGTVKERMTLYLETEKPYVNSEFSVFSIAIALELSESEVNSCIKNELHTTFVKLRTAARVNHALQLLENKSINRLTIEAIGEKSGFKTRSNFYAAFKEATGLTPTEFIQRK
jgi:AraC-like DNA-binding protein